MLRKKLLKWYIDEAIGLVVRCWGLGILYKEFTTPETDCSDKMFDNQFWVIFFLKYNQPIGFIHSLAQRMNQETSTPSKFDFVFLCHDSG